jgi:hypothetical protein
MPLVARFRGVVVLLALPERNDLPTLRFVDARKTFESSAQAAVQSRRDYDRRPDAHWVEATRAQRNRLHGGP